MRTAAYLVTCLSIVVSDGLVLRRLFFSAVEPAGFSVAQNLTPFASARHRDDGIFRRESSILKATPGSRISSHTSLYGSHMKESNVEERAFLVRLANQVLEVLAQPSAVSLPNGILLGLIALPFFSSLPQTLLTFGIFSGLNHLGRQVLPDGPDAKDGKKDNSMLDTLSLGFAATAGYLMTPSSAHIVSLAPVVASSSVATSGGLSFSVPMIALLGLLFASIAFLFQRATIPFDKVKSEEKINKSTPDVVDEWENIQKVTQERMFNVWDKQMETRETSLQEASHQKTAMSIVRDPPKDYQHLTCRDCYAPPGALGIVLHSTSQGPIVHSVREGSRLTSHVRPGDLIVAFNDLDTRSCRAEEVMQMLMARRSQQRKLTVLTDAKNQ